MDNQENISKRRKQIVLLIVLLILIAAVISGFISFFGGPTQILPGGFGDDVIREGNSGIVDTGDFNLPSNAGEEVRLRKIHDGPVAGYTTFTNIAGDEIVRLIERKTGHIYDYNLASNTHERISNTTIPRIYEAEFSSSGNEVLLRSVADDNITIKTFFGFLVEKTEDLKEGDTRYSLEGKYLRDNIIDADPSPESNRFFYYTEQNGMVGYILDADTGEETELSRYAFSEWLVQWATEETIYLQTKASARVAGHLYALDSRTGNIERVFGGLSGLTTNVNPAGTHAIISYNNTSGLTTEVLDLDTITTTTTSLQTLAEKCTWSNIVSKSLCGKPLINAANLPDSWYKSDIGFEDTFWEHQILAQNSIGLYNPNELGIEIDTSNIMLVTGEKEVVLKNKLDGSIWVLLVENFSRGIYTN